MDGMHGHANFLSLPLSRLKFASAAIHLKQIAGKCTLSCSPSFTHTRTHARVHTSLQVHAPRASPALRTAALRAARAPDVLYAAAAAAHDVHNGTAASAALLALTSLLGGGSCGVGDEGRAPHAPPVLPPTPATDDAVRRLAVLMHTASTAEGGLDSRVAFAAAAALAAYLRHCYLGTGG